MKPLFCCGVRAAFLLSVLMTNTPGAESADWPGWRGAGRDDVSTETGLLTQWPDGGPDRLWVSTEAGLGYSSFAVVGDVLFTLGAAESEEHIIALDAASGRRLWSTGIGPRLKNKWGDGPRSTPAVAEDRVVALGARGRVVCVSRTDGSLLWSRELQDYGGTVPNWGYSESPLIDRNRVIVTPGGDDGAMVAFSLSTGELLWQSSDITQPAHYSSVIVAEHGGRRQYIQLGPQALFAVAADDGTVLWEVSWPGRVAVIPTPIFYDGAVYVASGYGVGCMRVDLDSDSQPTVRYRNKVMKNQHGGVIRIGRCVYGYSDGPGWICQDLDSGDMVWNEKRVLGKGAISCADGLFYCLEQDTGICALVKATPEGWEERGRLKLMPQSRQRAPDGRIWVHPVISGGRLYLRDQEIICCYDISAQDGAAVPD